MKTYLSQSDIHGLGVFAGEFIPKGARVWRFVKGFDQTFSQSEFAKLPKQARDYIKFHGYVVDGKILFTVDNDHHMNHSDDANTRWHNGHIVAARDIRKGDEITNDYGLFDAEFCAAFLAKKTNGRHPKNGHANGHANGHGNGVLNGKHKANGRSNGAANGRHR